MSKTFKITVEGKEYEIPCDPPGDIGFPIIYAFSKYKDEPAEFFKHPQEIIDAVLLLVKLTDPKIKKIRPTTSELMDIVDKIGKHLTFGMKPKK